MSLALAPFDGATETDRDLPCRQYDPDLWFSEVPAELEVAKALCGDCPLRLSCLANAIQRREPWGVWGGEIFERGDLVPRKRPRGRPRKDAAATEALARAELQARATELARTLRDRDCGDQRARRSTVSAARTEDAA